MRYGDVEREHGNMLKRPRVNKLMARSDIVHAMLSARTVTFHPSTFQLPLETKQWYCTVNVAIGPKLMDQKEDALVILLEPFVAGGGRAVAERNVDDIGATLDCPGLPLDRPMGVRRGQDPCASCQPCRVYGRVRSLQSFEEVLDAE